MLFIYHEKFESHRSLIHKIDVQINENRSRYAKRIESLLIQHPYFKNDNLIIRNSPKTKNELIRFKNDFNNNWFSSGIRNENKNETKQLIIKSTQNKKDFVFSESMTSIFNWKNRSQFGMLLFTILKK